MEYKWMKKQSKEDEVIIDGPMTLSGSFAPLSELLKKKTFPFSLSVIPGVGDVVRGATIQ